MLDLLRREGSLLAAAIALAVAWPLEHAIVGGGQAVSLAASVALIAAILFASVRVAHHAETLAERLGEPYGTMVLTLSAVLVEVVILAIIMNESPSPTLARDTIYSAVMLDINALLGLSALLGGLRHGEQPYNVDSGNTYIVMILTGLGVSMVLPAFVPAGRDLFDERPANALPIEQLRERLRARLGDRAVHQLGSTTDPRPELAQKVTAHDDGWQEPSPRPTWLFERPIPLRGPAPQILAGPERLETGWWDGGEVCRDYYVVETSLGQYAWAFCAPGEQAGWMLQGWFA